MAERAYGHEEKAAKRRVILTSASDLFIAGDGELPTAAQVAEKAGLAKGTVYLYFRSKESIFSTILLEGWNEVLDLLENIFQPGDGTALQRVTAFITLMVDHIERRPELLRLDALGHAVLKAKLAPDERLAFMRAYEDQLTTGGSILDQALTLRSGRGAQLLMRTYSLIRGLWQSLDEVKGADSTKLTVTSFPIELKEALSEYWRGALDL